MYRIKLFLERHEIHLDNPLVLAPIIVTCIALAVVLGCR
jgi:hypothetical protein